MHSGIYCLVLRNPGCTITVGSLGPVAFRPGFHVYVGSALGPGGLARVARHVRCAHHGIERPRWHIDYLLTSDSFVLESVHCFPTGERLECRMAALVPGRPVPGFGCSDCRCCSHLFSCTSNPVRDLTRAARKLGLSAHSKTIKTSEVQC